MHHEPNFIGVIILTAIYALIFAINIINKKIIPKSAFIPLMLTHWLFVGGMALMVEVLYSYTIWQYVNNLPAIQQSPQLLGLIQVGLYTTYYTIATLLTNELVIKRDQYPLNFKTMSTDPIELELRPQIITGMLYFSISFIAFFIFYVYAYVYKL